MTRPSDGLPEDRPALRRMTDYGRSDEWRDICRQREARFEPQTFEHGLWLPQRLSGMTEDEVIAWLEEQRILEEKIREKFETEEAIFEMQWQERKAREKAEAERILTVSHGIVSKLDAKEKTEDDAQLPLGLVGRMR